MVHRDSYSDDFDEENGKALTTTSCPECAGTLRTDGGEISCEACGLIIDDQRIDHGPEWRRFEGETSNPKRTGAPLTATRHDRGLSSEIGYKTDGYGTPLTNQKQRQINRLRRRHHRARWQTKAERNLARACGEIQRLTSALDLPTSACEEACTIYRRAQNADLIRGRSIEILAAGSVYAACRCRGYGRAIAEVAEVAQCGEGKVKLGYRVLNAELGLEATVMRARDVLPRLASKSDAPDEVEYEARGLTQVAEQEGLTNGRKPSAVAAASLYLAGLNAGHRWTQAELAKVADVSVATLRARYYELHEVMG